MKTPKIRFKGFEGDWEEKKLGELCIWISEKYWERSDLEVFSVNNKNGFILQTEHFDNNEIASKDKRNYKIVTKNQFAYNPSRINVWSIAYLKNEDAVIVSPLYNIFECKKELNEMFLERFMKTFLFNKQRILNTEVSVRECLSFEGYCKIKIIKPETKEQEKIWSLFEQLDSHISKNQQKLEKLKNMKHSFLQKLFPKDWSALPELRFKGFEEAWEERKLGEIAECFSWGTPEANNPFYYWGNIPFIRSWEIHKNKTELYLTHLWLENSSAKIVSKWIILYALYWATSWEVNISKINWAINQAILAINPNKYYCSKFIVERLRKDKNKIIWTYLQGWQWNLSWDIVKKFALKFPLLPEQEKIWAFFEKLDTQITQQTQKLEKLKNLKQSLLEKMFI